MRPSGGDRAAGGAGLPHIMGILNAGPDSFSDPGLRDPGVLAEAGRRLAADGAAIVDVGGESGRTDRSAVSAGEELARVAPVIERLTADGLLVSVDTWRAAVARAAIAAGAVMVNDPSGLCEPEVADACAESGADLVVTHAGAPPKVKGFPAYADVVAEAALRLRERAAEAERRGVAPERILLDPGLDLGKTPAQSLELLRRLPELRLRGRRLLVAPSRKDFIGALTGRPPAGRDGGTLAAVGAAADAGADVLRVHDVAGTRDFLAVRAALRGEAPAPAPLAEDLRREPAA